MQRLHENDVQKRENMLEIQRPYVKKGKNRFENPTNSEMTYRNAKIRLKFNDLMSKTQK